MLMFGDNKKDKKGFSGLSSLITDIAEVETTKTNLTTESQSSQIKKTSVEKSQSKPEENKTVECTKCGAKIQIRKISVGFILECDECGDASYFNEKERHENGWENRILCSDESCIGVIGPYGQCKECGKPYNTDENYEKSSEEPESFDKNKRKGWSAGKWIIGIIAIGFMIWFIFNSGQSTKKSSYSPTSSSQTVSIPENRSAPHGSPRLDQIVELRYEKPSIGTNKILSGPQIRWCLREKIRIETMRDRINTNKSVYELNRMVNDYNRCCGSFRYRRGTLEQVRREVESNRSRIEAEAVSPVLDSGEIDWDYIARDRLKEKEDKDKERPIPPGGITWDYITRDRFKPEGVVEERRRNESPSPREIGRDRHYKDYSTGIVYDKNTGLEWITGPDEATSWSEAKRWVENLSVAGGGWRMPTRKELEAQYKKGVGSRNMTPLLKTTGWYVWSNEEKSLKWGFHFERGEAYLNHPDYKLATARGFAVRSRR